MKNSKFAFIALGLVVFFVGLFIVWLNRFDTSSDFREFRTALGFSFEADQQASLDDANNELKTLGQLEEGSQQNLMMSDEEKDFYEILNADFPSFEAIDTHCKESMHGHNWDSIPVEGASFDEYKAEHLANLFNDSFVQTFEGPAPVFTHIMDFILSHDSVDPQKIYQLMNDTSKLCLDREIIQKLRNFIEQSHSLGWDDVAKYKFSVIYEPMLFIFQPIHSPERMLLYINTLEALEQYGFVSFTANTSFQGVRTRLEDFHLSLVEDLQNERLSQSQKSEALRKYVNEMQMVSMELTEMAIEGTRRPIPRK